MLSSGKNMAGHWIAAIFIFVVFCATVSGAPYLGGGNRNHPYDFIEFFTKPKENIWTYMSSWDGAFTCQRAIITNISRTTVVVQTNYTLNGAKRSFITEGQLSNVWYPNGKRNVMTISDFTESYDRLKKELVYASEDKMCAVIEVGRYYGRPTVTFDLLLKESKLQDGPSDRCMIEYNENIEARSIRGTNRTVYTAACRS
uniref:Putative group i salivary lipocalin n=1 Tax=Rhipicephalus pulchellus TaxID=72859 RepID=L7LRA3_RHIPC